ncbi:MAG: M48 family peptidase, partial [Thermodesulfovibrionales bacterium]
MRGRAGIIASIAILILSCQTVPITGRQQLSLFPSETILSMSYRSYSEFLSKHNVVRDTEESRMVKRVGARIQHAVEAYFRSQGLT